MVIGGIWALYDFTPSLDGTRWNFGTRWLSTIRRWLLVVSGVKKPVDNQFMVIGSILALNDFTPSIDGEKWYLGNRWLSNQTTVFDGI